MTNEIKVIEASNAYRAAVIERDKAAAYRDAAQIEMRKAHDMAWQTENAVGEAHTKLMYAINHSIE
jgi:hypothetical protein